MNAGLAYRDPQLMGKVADEIRRLEVGRTVRLMEVCGGHTEAIYRYALRDLLPDWIELISGPGCPVCVTPNGFIDRAIALAEQADATLATFGDLMRVPGSSRSLAQVRAGGRDVRVFYSSLDALTWARRHPDRLVVFLGIGFETTACAIAATMADCICEGDSNFRLLSALKTMPAALDALLAAPDVRIDGLILPGHVTTVTGMEVFQFIADKYAIPCVVSGFEPLDMLETILMLGRQISEGRARVENQYRRVVRRSGNLRGQASISSIFQPCDMEWRGLGNIPGSGLQLSGEFAKWDALNIPVEVEPACEHPGCRCGEVLRGACHPTECALFAVACTPEEPCGACMVSSEGACAAVYNFGGIPKQNLRWRKAKIEAQKVLAYGG